MMLRNCPGPSSTGLSSCADALFSANTPHPLPYDRFGFQFPILANLLGVFVTLSLRLFIRLNLLQLKYSAVGWGFGAERS